MSDNGHRPTTVVQYSFDRRPVRRLVREMPATEQPVNRLLRYGPAALSQAELLAVVLGRPDALDLGQELLARFDGLAGLARAANAELEQVPGVGPTASARLKAALELGRRLVAAAPEERPVVRSPADAAHLLMADMGLLEQEHLRVVLLDTRHHVLATPTVYIGSLNVTTIRIAEVFREAIRRNCAAIVVAHNHPSGEPTPSPEDVRMTRQLVRAGQTLDVEVIDHLIIGRQRYVSLKERGLGFD